MEEKRDPGVLEEIEELFSFSETGHESVKGSERRCGEVPFELPDFYENLVYQPEPCKRCKRVDGGEFTSIGVRMVTPYSYLLLEGCDSDVICPVKTFQVMYYGVYIKFPDDILAGPESTMLIKATWEMLSGERRLENIDEMVKAYKKLVLYPEGKDGEKGKPAEEIREFARVIIKLLMETKFPVIVKYPYPKKHFVWIDLFSQKEELTEEDIVKIPCPFDPWDMMYIKVEYEDRDKFYSQNIELIPEKPSMDMSGGGFLAYRKQAEGLDGVFDGVKSSIPYVKVLKECFELLYREIRNVGIRRYVESFNKSVKILKELDLMLRGTDFCKSV